MRPGEIYFVDLDVAGRRPDIVVSREDLNQGNYTVMVLCTSANFAIRSKLPNCVPFLAGEFGFTKDCVAQTETILFVEKTRIDLSLGALGQLDDQRLRDLVKAIGYMIDSDCEPNP
jgi:mRNA-degrading endonuclease toxin of MazEF toxin-antitoxin module